MTELWSIYGDKVMCAVMIGCRPAPNNLPKFILWALSFFWLTGMATPRPPGTSHVQKDKVTVNFGENESMEASHPANLTHTQNPSLSKILLMGL